MCNPRRIELHVWFLVRVAQPEVFCRSRNRLQRWSDRPRAGRGRRRTTAPYRTRAMAEGEEDARPCPARRGRARDETRRPRRSRSMSGGVATYPVCGRMETWATETTSWHGYRVGYAMRRLLCMTATQVHASHCGRNGNLSPYSGLHVQRSARKRYAISSRVSEAPSRTARRTFTRS